MSCVNRAEEPLMATTTFSMRAAEAFVLGHGDPRRRATWKAAFGCGPVEVLVFELEPYLDAQGVWSALAADEPAGGLASAVVALRVLAGVNLGEDIFEVGQRTFDHLVAIRSPDGSWDAPGPWPGVGDDTARRAWYTAAIGMLLPQLTGSSNPDAARTLGDDAARWLADAWPQVAAAGPALWWAALGCCATAAPTVVHDATARLLGWLETPRAPSDLTWIHDAAHLAGLPSTHPLRQRAWTLLAGGQAPDGGWAAGSDAGWPADRVDATIQAMRAVVRP